LSGSGHNIIHLVGVAALKDRPLAALAAAVELPSANLTVANAINTLTRMLQGRNTVLLIDDADDLDPVSVGVIVAAHARARFTILSVTRKAGLHSLADRPLVEIQPSVRVTLRSMRFDQLHDTVHRLLPGRVEAATIAQISTLSGGLPGLVKALIDVGRRTGKLSQVDGVWRVEGNLWSSELTSAVEPLLNGLTQDQFAALTKLAILGSVTLETAHEFMDSETFAVLSEAGLLQVIRTAVGPVVGIFPPLVLEYLQHETTPTTLLAAQDGLATPLPRAAHNIAKLLDEYNYTRDTAPSVLSLHVSEHWRAEVAMRRSAWRKNPVPETATKLLVAMHAASATADEIEEVLQHTKSQGTQRELGEMESWHAVYRATERGEVQQAIAQLEEARKRLPEVDAMIRGCMAHLEFTYVRVPDFENFEPAKEGEDPVGNESLWSVRAESLLALGRTEDAAEHLSEHKAQDREYSSHMQAERALMLVLSGRIDEGVEHALREMKQGRNSLNKGILQAFGYVASLGMALTGRFEELDAMTATMLSFTGDTALFRHFHSATLSLASIAANWQGRDDYAISLAHQVATSGVCAGPFPVMLPSMATALVTGQNPECSDTLWESIVDRLERGYIAAGIIAAATAVEQMSKPKQALILGDYLDGVQSPMLLTIAKYVHAVADGDIKELREVAEELVEQGLIVIAVRAMVRIAVLERNSGDAERAAESADNAWSLTAALNARCPALFAPLTDLIDLSLREREIAMLATEGMATPEIANELDLSVRTVENHISSIYRKVGVGNRKRLREVVSTWAA
jgi:DNA-binding CsgD family transcriptional regulator/nitroreductase